MTYNVQEIKNNTRIDQYLGIIFPNLSRSSIKRLILNKMVFLNDDNVKPNKILKVGDKIEVLEKNLPEFVEKYHLNEIEATDMPLDIIFENENIIVLNKQEGVVVHPSYNHINDTLMNGLTSYILKSSDPFVKIRPVNRLDKETSGVILFSKNLESHNFYTKQFKKREAVKEYKAIVKGDFTEELKGRPFIKLSGFIGKNPEGFTYRVSTNSNDEYAETDIYFQELILKEDFYYSLLKVVPHTGRTHQIRVHLASLDYPIVGDSLYHGDQFKRVLLHSQTLKLKDQKGSEQVFTANPKNWF